MIKLYHFSSREINDAAYPLQGTLHDTHYDIQAKVSTKEKTAEFTTTVMFRSQEDNVSKIVFFMGSAMVVDSVKKGDIPLKFGVSPSLLGQVIRIFPDVPLKKDEVCTLAFHYTAKVEEGTLFATMKDDYGEFEFMSGWYPLVYMEDIYTMDMAIALPEYQVAVTNAPLMNPTPQQAAGYLGGFFARCQLR